MSIRRHAGGALSLVAGLLGLASPSKAGELALRAVTLPEALAYARAHQPAVRAALGRIATEQAFAAVPRAGWYPTAGLTGYSPTSAVDLVRNIILWRSSSLR